MSFEHKQILVLIGMPKDAPICLGEVGLRVPKNTYLYVLVMIGMPKDERFILKCTNKLR